MYYYVYDEFVQDPKFAKEISHIETRLTDLGVSGKIGRLALFRDASELIRDEVRRGANTIIAVGSDLTLRKVIDAAAESGVTIGVIPVGTQDNAIAGMLGVPSGVAACEVISARITEDVDTGVVNSRRFINHFTCVVTSEMSILCDRAFTLKPKINDTIEVRNLADAESDVRAADPSDGKLEIVIRTPKKGWFGRKQDEVSIVTIERAVISSVDATRVEVDGEPFESNELNIEVLPKHLTLITSKRRNY